MINRRIDPTLEAQTCAVLWRADHLLRRRSWNAVVQSYFSSSGAEADRVFTGSRYLPGEFGWLGAAGMLILGAAFAWWHLHPDQGRSVPKGSDRLPLAVDVAVVPQRPKAQDARRSHVNPARWTPQHTSFMISDLLLPPRLPS